MSYASIKGRSAPQAASTPSRRPAAPITEAESQRIRENIATVKAHLPEVVPLIKELHDAGLIDGWRAVQNVQIFTEHEKEA